MGAAVRIDATAWSDLRFVTLARLMGYADSDHALSKCSRLWSWQTENYTPECPTYIVDEDTIESALGHGGAHAMVRSRLAESTPDGFRIKGSKGRIEWLHQRRIASAKGGEAKKRNSSNKGKPDGYGHGLPNEHPEQRPTQEPEQSPPTLTLKDLSSPRAIPSTPVPSTTNGTPPEPSLDAIWQELEDERCRVASLMHVEVSPLMAHDVGRQDLAASLSQAALQKKRGQVVADARKAISVAGAEVLAGKREFKWFTGVVFEPRTWRALCGSTVGEAMTKKERSGARDHIHLVENPKDPRI